MECNRKEEGMSDYLEGVIGIEAEATAESEVFND
jgi:hypothetical protein